MACIGMKIKTKKKKRVRVFGYIGSYGQFVIYPSNEKRYK